MPGQVYSTNSLGGNWSTPYLTDRFRHRAQPLFKLRQFIDTKEAIGKRKGDTFLFDKAGDVATQGGTLLETQTIPETNYITNQGTATIVEWGNSIPFTEKLEELAQFDTPSVTEMKLHNDAIRALESAAGDQYAASDFIAVCSSGSSVAITTNGTATATATGDLTAANVRTIADFMKKNFVPKYDNENYICVASVAALSGMHADTGSGGWIDISKFTDKQVMNIFNGEVGQFYKVRFVEETGYLSNAIGNASGHGEAVFFGEDAVYEAVTTPEMIRVKNSVDYDRDRGLAWYALLGFQIVWDYSTDTEQHIVFVTSA